jgi:hypothetical protein
MLSLVNKKQALYALNYTSVNYTEEKPQNLHAPLQLKPGLFYTLLFAFK